MNGQKQDRRMKAIEEMERELAEPLGHFRSAVTALADRAMTRTARLVTPREKRPAWRGRWAYAWAPAGLVVVLLGVGLTVTDHGPARQPMASHAVVARVEQAPTPQQVSDTALLTEIDQDLTQNAPTPLAPLEISTTGSNQSTQAEETTYGVEP